MKPGKKIERSERMKAAEREYQIAEKAGEALVRDSGFLTRSRLSAADLQKHLAKLHDTYLIRLFAEFETGLKDYWKKPQDPNHGRDQRPGLKPESP